MVLGGFVCVKKGWVFGNQAYHVSRKNINRVVGIKQLRETLCVLVVVGGIQEPKSISQVGVARITCMLVQLQCSQHWTAGSTPCNVVEWNGVEGVLVVFESTLDLSQNKQEVALHLVISLTEYSSQFRYFLTEMLLA